MYAKLIFRNAKRSVKDYLIYIVTMTICVALFYAFLSISSSYYNPDIGSVYDFRVLSDALRTAICMITLLLLFLIRFVNRYMLRRRQKDFAVQSVMGMEQKTIGRIFFAETFIMGMISIAAGIFLGVICSQFMTAMLLTSYEKTYTFAWTLFPDTVLWTVGFFIVSFCIMGVFHTRAIRKTKIIDMFLASKENEPNFQKSRQIFGVVILFEIVTVWMLFTGIQKVWFYYDSRLAIPVRLTYWANIFFPMLLLLWPVLWLIKKKKGGSVTLVAGLLAGSVFSACSAAVFLVFTNKYYLPLGSGIYKQYLLFVLLDLIFFIYAFHYLAASFLAAWKERSGEHRYRGDVLFFYGQMISGLRTTSKTMTVICMTLTLAIVMFVAAPVLTGWALGYLDSRSMYDVQVYSGYNQVYDEKDLPHDSYEIVTKFLAEHEIQAAYDHAFYLYLPQKKEFHNRQKYDFPIVAISLSDYNNIREALGYGRITLAENEFTTQWRSVAAAEAENFTKAHTSVMTDAGELRLSRNSYYKEEIGQTVYNSYTDVLYVFPDWVCEKLLSVIRNRYIITTEAITYQDACEMERLFEENYPERTENGAEYGVRLRTLQRNSTKANNFVLQAAMFYSSIVLMVICLTVLSLQQLLDAGQHQYRFDVLRKLGVEERRIGTLVLKQLGVWFGLPIVTAIVVSCLVSACFIQTVAAEISAYIGFRTLMVQIGTITGALAVLLLCYFVSTWMLFRRLIDK